MTFGLQGKAARHSNAWLLETVPRRHLFPYLPTVPALRGHRCPGYLSNILKNGFERRQVTVNVAERGDPHNKPLSLVGEINSRSFQKPFLHHRRRHGQQPVDRDTLGVCRRTAQLICS
jgi:hypothetical protein